LSDIVLKNKNGIKQIYSGVDIIKIADSKENFNNYVSEPVGDVEFTYNGTFDIKNKARAIVAVEGGSAIPPQVSSEEQMNALFESGEIGGVYKYTGETTDIYEQGGLYLLGDKLITFTIDDVLYVAEEDMTWSQWCKSVYNFNGFWEDGSGGIFSSTEGSVRLEGTKIYGFMPIIADAVYSA
jgi:hypothetical protein